MTKSYTQLNYWKRGVRTLTFAALTSRLAATAFAPAAAQAQSPTRAMQDGFMGEIFRNAASFCPRNTVLADGQILWNGQHTALHSLLQTKFGGHGAQFALPKLAPPGKSQTESYGLRWCINLNGIYPTKGNGGHPKASAEFMPFAASDCPQGWSQNSDQGMPHSEIISWCTNTNADSNSKSFLGRLHLYSGDGCPEGTMAADGRSLQIPENQPLFALLGVEYGGDGRFAFSLPNLAAPNQNMTWCVVTDGLWPERP